MIVGNDALKTITEDIKVKKLPTEEEFKQQIKKYIIELNDFLTKINTYKKKLEKIQKQIDIIYNNGNRDNIKISNIYAIINDFNLSFKEMVPIFNKGYKLSLDIRKFFTGQTINYKIGYYSKYKNGEIHFIQSEITKDDFLNNEILFINFSENIYRTIKEGKKINLSLSSFVMKSKMGTKNRILNSFSEDEQEEALMNYKTNDQVWIALEKIWNETNNIYKNQKRYRGSLLEVYNIITDEKNFDKPLSPSGPKQGGQYKVNSRRAIWNIIRNKIIPAQITNNSNYLMGGDVGANQFKLRQAQLTSSLDTIVRNCVKIKDAFHKDGTVDFKKLQSLFIKDLNSKKIKNEFIAKTDELFQQEGENYLIQMAQKFGMQPLKSITT